MHRSTMTVVMFALALLASCDDGGGSWSPGQTADIVGPLVNGRTRAEATTRWSTGDGDLALYGDETGVQSIGPSNWIQFRWMQISHDTLVVDLDAAPVTWRALVVVEVGDGWFAATRADGAREFTFTKTNGGL